MREARASLGAHGWLSQVPALFRDAVLDRCTLKSMARGDVLYRLGDEPDGLYGVVGGSFAIEMAPHERGPNLTHTFRPGSWLGASALLKRRPRNATVLATRPSRHLHLSGREFSALAARDPEAWRWLGVLGIATLEVAVGALDDLTIRRPEQRIVAILLRLAGVRLGDNPLDPGPELDLTQHDLAHLANLSRASVGEHLDRLAADSLTARSYGRIGLVDVAGLRAILEASA